MPRGAKPSIWLTWTGHNPLPGYLELCMESVRRHNAAHFDVTLIRPQNVAKFLPDLHPAYELLSYPHRADYLRCELLHRCGGIYFDMDTLCYAGMQRWYGHVHDHDIVSYDGGPWGEIFGLGMFGPTRRDSILTREWSARLRARLDMRLADLRRHRSEHPDEAGDCLGWTEILGDIVTPLSYELRDRGELSFFKVGGEHFTAASGLYTVGELFELRPLGIHESTDVLILNNALYPQEFKRLSRDQVLASGCGLANLIRQAL